MSTEQPTPDELTAENELICEKLLGWKKAQSCGEQEWFCNHDLRDETSGPFLTRVTPSFDTWAEAGLILEALQAMVGWEPARALSRFGWLLKTHELTPLAIRAEALEYIRRQS